MNEAYENQALQTQETADTSVTQHQQTQYIKTQQPPQNPLKSNRSSGLCLLLSIVTFGIYYIYLMSKISTDINKIASPHDNKDTSPFWVAIILSLLTLGLYFLLWQARLSDRMSKELKRRELSFKFSSTDLLVYGMLLAVFTCGITSLVYFDKLIRAMNALSADYNEKGC